jgi:hypothetical protein
MLSCTSQTDFGARESHGRHMGYSPDTRRSHTVDNFRAPGAEKAGSWGHRHPPPGHIIQSRLSADGQKAAFPGLDRSGRRADDVKHSAAGRTSLPAMYDRFPPHRLLTASGAQDPLTTTSRPPRVYRMPDLTVLSELGLLACAGLWWLARPWATPDAIPPGTVLQTPAASGTV